MDKLKKQKLLQEKKLKENGKEVSENWWSNSLENQEENSFDFESVEEDDQVLITSPK
jgi:hypothetical protein